MPAGGVAGWAADLTESLGAVGAGVAIALENLFPPLPSEVILPLAGFAAARGDLSLTAVLWWTTAGSVAGALSLYALGALLGRERMVASAARIPLVKVSDIQRAEAWFARHGTKAVFFGRMIPLFRSMISVPAGIERMRLPLFLALTTAGSALWNALFVLAGYLLGERWHQVTDLAGTYSTAVLGATALAVLGFAVLRLVKAKSGGRRAGG
nr:DedA family protein [Streptomyces sp. AA1529]